MNFDWNQKPFTGAMKYDRNYAPADFRPQNWPEISVTLKFYVFSALGDLPPFIFSKKNEKKFFLHFFVLCKYLCL